MQSKSELEAWYERVDPWGYETNPEDAKRKARILSLIPAKQYQRALDIGCGEGFITRDLPASIIEGVEKSDLAAARLPSNIIRVQAPTGKYDLIVGTGILYPQYDFQLFTKWVIEHASGIVLLSNIKSWEINMLPVGKQVYEEEYPYREFTQKLRIYDFSSPSQYRSENQ